MTEQDSAAIDAGAAPALSRFRDLGARAAAGSDRWLLAAGAVLVPLGIVLIILGYIGASNTPFAFEQTPYLISGGLLGLALVFIGGFVYFTHWQTRSVREAREHQREVIDALERIAVLLGDTSGVTASSSPAAATAFVVTEKGSMFHRADCDVALRATKVRPVRASDRNLKPCGICNPA